MDWEYTGGRDPPRGVSEVAAAVADRLDATGKDEQVVTTVRDSSEPLDEPVLTVLGKPITIGQAVHYAIRVGLADADEVVDLTPGRADDPRFTFYTHPETLSESNRLFPPAVLAKSYLYGYWPITAKVNEGGNIETTSDIEADNLWEFRKFSLVCDPEEDHLRENEEDLEGWFEDADAVGGFADHVTGDTIDWGKYIPLYRTKMVEAYRVNAVADAIDWAEFPDLPEARPAVKNRFEVNRNPRVGDFIRQAVLQGLEASHPSIKDISTGPEPWRTDRVSMLVQPTSHGEPGMDTNRFYPDVARKKLFEYGYRPIDGWFDTPVVGHESTDPHPRRRIEFARGRALQDWCSETLTSTPLFDDEAQVETVIGDLLTDLDVPPCLYAEAIPYRELYHRAHEQRGLY